MIPLGPCQMSGQAIELESSISGVHVFTEWYPEWKSDKGNSLPIWRIFDLYKEAM